MNKIELSSVYDPHSLEERVYNRWEESGNFSPHGEGSSYCVMIPPPNVTGSLHMGHAFQNTLMDALIRYHRMKGCQTLWQAGTDHAGIATQMVVERLLHNEGISRADLGREKFIDRVWNWKASSGGTITNQLRRLGASLDWSRERFTMDEELSEAVREVFVSLYDEGLIYRGKRLVNWDPVLLTAISDLEVISEEEEGFLWHFRYPITDSSEFVIIATTRPETMLGDTAVAVHPDDDRYSHLVGQTVTLPLVNRRIPIVSDHYVDPDFGTGCVKITPAHDFNDFDVGERNNLEVINVMTPQAGINLPDSDYHGMSRTKARDKIVEDLQKLGLVEKVENHRYKVPRGDRTGEIIEPYLTDQWFVRTKPLAEPAINAVRNGTIRFVPKNWERTYYDWMENIEDWCISRQIWWGHRIPAWYDSDGNAFVARNEQDAYEQAREVYGNSEFKLRQDDDVLDTWFSSALWPFSTLGWPKHTDELQTFYPTNVLVTGFDIIFFWVARMIMFGLKFAGDIPFHEVYIHGLVRDSEGQKMSKSKGNILDPLDLIDGIDLENLIKKRTTGLMQPDLAPKIENSTRKQYPDGIPAYGTDALRFTFARLATQGRDIRFDLGRIEGYRNFCNKLWNAARFVLMNAADESPYNVNDLQPVTTAEKWIISRLHYTTSEIEKAIKIYRFDIASKILYEFIWDEYCAWFIEITKIMIRSEFIEENQKISLHRTLLLILDSSLRLLHPFMPYITEEIWQKIRTKGSAESIMFEPYSDDFSAWASEDAVKEIDWVKAVVSSIRNLRSEMNFSPGDRIRAFHQNAGTLELKYLSKNSHVIQELARLQSFELFSGSDPESSESDSYKFVSALVGDFRIVLSVGELRDIEKQIGRIEKLIAEQTQQIQRSTAKLNNEKFLANAPAEIVEKERQRLLDCQKTLVELDLRCSKLKTYAT